MWTRKELKENGKRNFKKNAWICIAICFLLGFFTTEYASSLSVVTQYDKDKEVAKDVVIRENKTYNFEVLFDDKKINTFLSNTIDSFTKDSGFIYKFIDGIKKMSADDYLVATIVFISCFLLIFYQFFLVNPFIVGSRKFFLENREFNNVPISVSVSMFKEKGYLNIVKVMFLRYLYLVLWSFTIVGVFIKIYSYRMVPYILAEDHEISAKDAFNKSIQMMKGNKWKTFILDLSFIGWNILGALTLGLVGILYVNPYNACTNCELYVALKNNKKKAA